MIVQKSSTFNFDPLTIVEPSTQWRRCSCWCRYRSNHTSKLLICSNELPEHTRGFSLELPSRASDLAIDEFQYRCSKVVWVLSRRPILRPLRSDLIQESRCLCSNSLE